jgi:hypothetical protein
MDGFGDRMILFNSSVIRSCDTMLILSVLFFMAATAISSILKFNCDAKRMARIMRNGSSEKVSTGFKRCTDQFLLQIGHAAKWIKQFSKSIGVQGYGQCVDGKIAAFLVVFQCAILNNRFSRI